MQTYVIEKFNIIQSKINKFRIL